MTLESLINGIAKAKAVLEEHGAVPAKVEITQAQYDALKALCAHPAEGQPDSILGLKMVVRG